MIIYQFKNGSKSERSLFINNIMPCEIIKKLKVSRRRIERINNLQNILINILESIKEIQLQNTLININIIISNNLLLLLLESQT
jgi:hypothetical protein